MKIIVLLTALLVSFCFACKNTFGHRSLLAERQQLIASANLQEGSLATSGYSHYIA
jgi:cell division protein FtsL